MGKDLISPNTRTSSRLLDNSFDLLFAGVNIFKKAGGSFNYQNNLKELKSGLLLITIAVELLLKSKIASLNWKKIFEKSREIDSNKIFTGEFESLKFGKCISTLKSMSIPINSETEENIIKIRNTRNKVVHYSYTSNGDEFLTLTSKAIDIFIEFYRKYILFDFHEEYDRTKRIDFELKKVNEYIKVRLTTLKENNKGKEKPLTHYFSECSICLQKVFIIKDNRIVLCSFCKQEEDIVEVASHYSNLNKQVKTCPKCDRKSMTALHTRNEKEVWQCIICGYSLPTKFNQ